MAQKNSDTANLYRRHLEGRLMIQGDSRRNAEHLERLLRLEWDHWTQCRDEGAPGRNGTDGMALYLTRNHIIALRRDVETWCDPEDYPETYHRGIPPEFTMWYMVAPQSIPERALRVFRKVVKSPQYAELDRLTEELTDEEACAIGGARKADEGRARLRHPLTTCQYMLADAERLAKEACTDEEWIRPNASLLCDIRLYAKTKELNIGGIMEKLEEIKRAQRAMRAGHTGCRGFVGSWCADCNRCMTPEATATGQMAWV